MYGLTILILIIIMINIINIEIIEISNILYKNMWIIYKVDCIYNRNNNNLKQKLSYITYINNKKQKQYI